MRKKILALSLAVLCTATSIYAFEAQRSSSGCNGKKCEMRMEKNAPHQNDSVRSIMTTLSDMDLSKEQWKDIRQIMFTLKEQMIENFDEKNKSHFINKDGKFDKESFIKSKFSLSKERIEIQAKTIESILNTLNESQRKALASKMSSNE